MVETHKIEETMNAIVFNWICTLFLTAVKILIPLKTKGGDGVGLPYERGRDARRKFWIIPLKETNLGVAQPLFDP